MQFCNLEYWKSLNMIHLFLFMIEFLLYFFFMNLLCEMTCPNLTVGRKLVSFALEKRSFMWKFRANEMNMVS